MKEDQRFEVFKISVRVNMESDAPMSLREWRSFVDSRNEGFMNSASHASFTMARVVFSYLCGIRRSLTRKTGGCKAQAVIDQYVMTWLEQGQNPLDNMSVRFLT